MKKHLSAAILRHRESQAELAKHAGMNPATISRVCNGQRPTEDVLRAICTGWANERKGVDLMCAHLRDEIQRGGHGTHQIDVAPADYQDEKKARILDTIRTTMDHDPQLFTLIEDLAKMIDRHAEREKEATE